MSEKLAKHFLEQAKGNISTKGFCHLNIRKKDEVNQNAVAVQMVTPAAAATAIAKEKTQKKKSIRVRPRGTIF